VSGVLQVDGTARQHCCIPRMNMHRTINPAIAFMAKQSYQDANDCAR
jgi:hypothetical protein